jgi:hypothetical protein
MSRIHGQITDTKHGQTPVIYKAQAIHHGLSPKGLLISVPPIRVKTMMGNRFNILKSVAQGLYYFSSRPNRLEMLGERLSSMPSFSAIAIGFENALV